MTRLRSSMIVVLGICLAVSLAQTTSAQRGRGFGFGGLGVSKVQLASLDVVQTALNLNDEQKTFTAELSEKLREDRRALRQDGGGGGFAEIREKTEELNAEASTKLLAKLDDAQRKRLTEIYIQVSGANALADDEVSKALGLSAAQVQALAAARDENRQAARDAFQDFQDLSDDERAEAREKVRKEGDDRLLAVLTAEQREQFGKMKGEAIEIDTSQLFGRRGGGRGAGGGGRPDRP